MKTFLTIWSGQFVSQIGTALTRFALLVWVYEQTGKATDVALLGFFAFLPAFFVSPFAGVWVDRLERRKVMLLADASAGQNDRKGGRNQPDKRQQQDHATDDEETKQFAKGSLSMHG